MGIVDARSWGQIVADIHARLANAAEQMADQAEELAAILERASERGDTPRRLETARRERAIAAVQRRNAERLRQAGTGPVALEPLPRLLPEQTAIHN